MDNGAELFTEFKVVKVEGNTLVSQKGEKVEAKYVINCAGNGAEDVANLFGDYSFKLGRRKGEYMLLDNASKGYVKTTVFTLPTKAGKGVLVTPTVDNNILVGPTSIEEELYDTSIRREGFDELKQKASLMCKNIPFQNTITSFAGVRIYCDRHDFVIEESKANQNLFNVVGIESPGLTAAPAIGRKASEDLAEMLGLDDNPAFQPKRQGFRKPFEMSKEEYRELIKKDPSYGRIVCRCESVTEGEIRDAIRRKVGAKSLDGVKRRVRAGMGRCQSGFCSPKIMEVIAKNLGIDILQVSKHGAGSEILVGKIKE
jgi:glycerol-3-phosphate dehydrogenase